ICSARAARRSGRAAERSDLKRRRHRDIESARVGSPRMTGVEWIVEAYGCAPDRLRDLPTLQALFAEIIGDLALHPCQDGHWHQFPGSGGVTGVSLLA